MESLKNSAAWFAVTLSPQSRVTALSPGSEGFAGYAGREMVGCPITQFLADKTVFEMPGILDAAKEAGKWEGEITYRDRQGREVRTQGNVIPLSDKENRDSGYLIISRLKELKDSIDGAGPIYADVGFRVRALVHDLNNPLAVIMGFTQLLSLDSHCTGKIRSDIEKLYSELQKMAHAVEKLHGYAHSLCERVSDPAPVKNTFKNSA